MGLIENQIVTAYRHLARQRTKLSQVDINL